MNQELKKKEKAKQVREKKAKASAKEVTKASVRFCSLEKDSL